MAEEKLQKARLRHVSRPESMGSGCSVASVARAAPFRSGRIAYHTTFDCSPVHQHAHGNERSVTTRQGLVLTRFPTPVCRSEYVEIGAQLEALLAAVPGAV